jgi:hypothetical protein
MQRQERQPFRAVLGHVQRRIRRLGDVWAIALRRSSHRRCSGVAEKVFRYSFELTSPPS